jgi:ABC-type branched-subunit amino acid transport system permease subunit
LTFIFSFPCPQALLGIAQVLRLSTVNYTALLSGYFPVPASQIHRLFSLGRQEQASHIYLVLLLCLLIICFTLSWNNIEANIKAADIAPGRLFIIFALSVLT